MHSWWEAGAFLGFLALWMVFQTGREKWRMYKSKGWPTTPGAITNIQVRKVDGGLNGIAYWKLSFDYSYRVTQEHSGSYSFNCTSEAMAQGAVAGLENKQATVHFNPANESKGVVWEDEVWNIWWDTYWKLTHTDANDNS
jgi:hypothetical protein